MRNTTMKTMTRLAMFVIPLAGLRATCSPSPRPPAEAVLAGTWTVTVESAPDLKQLSLTFDEEGQLSTVTYKLGDNAVITVPSPVGVTTVSGKDVNIATTFKGNGLEFQGTLNDANTIMTGSLTTHIVVGSVVVTIDNGPATLTKQ